MQIRAKLSYFFKEYRNAKKSLRLMDDETYSLNFTAAELMRNTHSIEKGLSIDQPHLGFGHAKQREMLQQIAQLQAKRSAYYNEICDTALSALHEYIAYHEDQGYTDAFCVELKEYLSKQQIQGKTKTGGIIRVSKDDLKYDIKTIEDFFNSRHSVRDFELTPVDDETINQALVLAQRAPSACNRQGFRVYVLSAKKSREYAESLSGIGGFAEQVGRFILITGKRSSYRITENYQYIVSASIYAAYLSLTLHLYGLGCCIVQRPVVWTKEWSAKRDALGIEKDEQLVLLLAVGNLKEEFNVPISNRLSKDSLIRYIE